MRPLLFLAFSLLLFSGCKGCQKDQDAAPQTEVVDLQEAAQATENDDAPEENKGEDLSAYTHKKVERWWISAKLEPCMRDGEGTTCLRIRREGRPNWQTLYGDIRDFAYEEGTDYILEVTVLSKEEDAQEADERYVLKEQVVPTGEEEEEGCQSDTDCQEDEMCTGPAGCFVPWTCVARRPCASQTSQFCSCDGETIEGPINCAPAPYKHPGPCR